MTGKLTDSYVDRTGLYETQERPEDAAEYTYNEMCFLFDTIYGKPSQCEFANVIREKGFDQALETYDETTKLIKGLLQSTDPVEFTFGLTLLQYYMYDGGHTTTNYELVTELAGAYSTSWLYSGCNLQQWAAEYPQVVEVLMQGMRKAALQKQFQETRAAVFKEKGYQKVWEGDAGCTLYRSGKTVIFSFDSFNQVVTPWFKKALDYSAQNGIKNFIVDLSCNGGGDSSVLCYMAAVMKNKDRNSNVASMSIRDEVTGGEYRSNFLLDLNLDGKFDDADKKVYYDLDFAVLASPFSFSCGNLTPFVAKDQGIMIMGDRSGGGACSIMKAYTADGHFMAVSSSQYFICDSGADVDLGVEVDVNLMKKTADGQYDNSAFYDLDALGIYMNEFYGKFSNEWVDGKWYDKNGTAHADKVEIAVKAGDTVTITGLPVQTYTVTEKNPADTAADGFEIDGNKSVPTRVNVEVPKDGTGEAELINAYKKSVVYTGNLTLKKTVTGPDGCTKTQEFTFYVKGADGKWYGEDGKASDTQVGVKVTAGSTGVTITGLPVQKYDITEKTSGTASSGYELDTANSDTSKDNVEVAKDPAT